MNKQKLTAYVIVAAAVLLQPVALLAADAPEMYDARLEGFYDGQAVKNFTMSGVGGTSSIWITMMILTIICVAVMFKSAHRTHLD